MSENLLKAYQATPSFALWDGEHAILNFTGKLDQDFIKVDASGNEQHYLGIECLLISHSNENYKHRHDTICILRTGKESTLAKWVNDDRGGLKAVPFLKRTIFKVFNSKKLGFDLRVETMEKE